MLIDHTYVLQGREVVRPRSEEECLEFLEEFNRRRVAEDTVHAEEVDVWVSTVFLCFDHNHWGEGPPIVFETMAFFSSREAQKEEVAGLTRRYSTYEEAEAGHELVVALVRQMGDYFYHQLLEDLHDDDTHPAADHTEEVP